MGLIDGETKVGNIRVAHLRRGKSMYARITKYQVDPAKIDDMMVQIDELKAQLA